MRRTLGSLVALATVASACRNDADGSADVVGAAAPSSSAVPMRPVDRLAPGELAEGNQSAFGIPVPRGMRLDANFADAAHVVGTVRAEDVANYVRERVQVDRVEIGAARTVFPRAFVKGDPSKRVFQIEVIADGPTTRLVIRDLTRPPAEPGLSEEERWRKAGFSPNGEPLNPRELH